MLPVQKVVYAGLRYNFKQDQLFIITFNERDS